MACTCRSVNEVICHGIPDERELQAGDICNGECHRYSATCWCPACSVLCFSPITFYFLFSSPISFLCFESSQYSPHYFLAFNSNL